MRTILLVVMRQRQEGLNSVGHRAAHFEHLAPEPLASEVG